MSCIVHVEHERVCTRKVHTQHRIHSIRYVVDNNVCVSLSLSLYICMYIVCNAVFNTQLILHKYTRIHGVN